MTTGIALAQVYDIDPNVNAQPMNLSASAFVGTGNDVLIGGTHHRRQRRKFTACPRARSRSISRERRSSYPTG